MTENEDVELQRKVSHYLQPILNHQFLNNFAYSVVDKFNCYEFFDPFPFDFFACVVTLEEEQSESVQNGQTLRKIG